jgi:hypothetical protein
MRVSTSKHRHSKHTLISALRRHQRTVTGSRSYKGMKTCPAEESATKQSPWRMVISFVTISPHACANCTDTSVALVRLFCWALRDLAPVSLWAARCNARALGALRLALRSYTRFGKSSPASSHLPPTECGQERHNPVDENPRCCEFCEGAEGRTYEPEGPLRQCDRSATPKPRQPFERPSRSPWDDKVLATEEPIGPCSVESVVVI